MANRTILLKDRQTKKEVEEKVYGKEGMELCYGNKLGLFLTSHILVREKASEVMGFLNNTSRSCAKIGPFVDKFQIDMSECLEPRREAYRSFNDFFARKLKKEARPIHSSLKSLISPADGRALVFPHLQEDSLLYVKWAKVLLKDLFQSESLVNTFKKGSCMIVRLCPTDYHRFHFPISGQASLTQVIPGKYHSVSPYALEQNIPVYCLNKRTLCTVDTEKYGKVLFMEIGALGVGSIHQTYTSGKVQKGDEKGYFEFGGSTVIVFFQENKMKFEEDLILNSQEGFETLLKMGEKIGEWL